VNPEPSSDGAPRGRWGSCSSRVLLVSSSMRARTCSLAEVELEPLRSAARRNSTPCPRRIGRGEGHGRGVEGRSVEVGGNTPRLRGDAGGISASWETRSRSQGRSRGARVGKTIGVEVQGGPEERDGRRKRGSDSSSLCHWLRRSTTHVLRGEDPCRRRPTGTASGTAIMRLVRREPRRQRCSRGRHVPRPCSRPTGRSSRIPPSRTWRRRSSRGRRCSGGTARIVPTALAGSARG